MQKNDNYFSQYGSSLIEVILSITLALILVPFMYVQISDMNDSVKDIAAANRIVKMHDSIKNYIQIHNAEFSQSDVYVFCNSGDDCDTDECDNCDVLETIAPGAERGVVVQNGTNGTTEMFVEFNIDNTKYRAANVARYIGNDAAIVSGDNIAYSEYWATAFSGDDAFTPGNLVYHVESDEYIDDEENYLHINADYGYNVMEQNLNLNGYDIINAKNVKTQAISFNNGTVNQITLTDVGTTIKTTINVSAKLIEFGPLIETEGKNFDFVNLSCIDNNGTFTIKNFNLIFHNNLISENAGINVRETADVSDQISIGGGLLVKNDSNKPTTATFDNIFIDSGELKVDDIIGKTLGCENGGTSCEVRLTTQQSTQIDHEFVFDLSSDLSDANADYISFKRAGRHPRKNVKRVLGTPNNIGTIYSNLQ